MRLIADAMLGRLARWLRALGHDVVYDEALDDDDLVRRARAEVRPYWEGSHTRRMRRWLEAVARDR